MTAMLTTKDPVTGEVTVTNPFTGEKMAPSADTKPDPFDASDEPVRSGPSLLSSVIGYAVTRDEAKDLGSINDDALKWRIKDHLKFQEESKKFNDPFGSPSERAEELARIEAEKKAAQRVLDDPKALELLREEAADMYQFGEVSPESLKAEESLMKSKFVAPMDAQEEPKPAASPAAKAGPAPKKQPDFRKEMDAAFDEAFGAGSARQFHKDETATMTPLLDARGGLIGMEAFTRKNGGLVQDGGRDPRLKNAALKIFVNMSPHTVALDSGRQARAVDADGATVSQPRPRRLVMPGCVVEVKTPYEERADKGQETVLVLGGKGAFSIGDYDGRKDFDKSAVLPGVKVDLSHLRTAPGGAKMKAQVRTHLEQFGEKRPALHANTLAPSPAI